MATATVRSEAFEWVPTQRVTHRLVGLLHRLARWTSWEPAPWPGSAEARLRLEAARVRKLADRVRQSNPGFAADLEAAVLRHEAKHGQGLWLPARAIAGRSGTDPTL